MTTTVAEAAGPQDAPRRKAPLIIIIGADKGGTGKTTISRALLDYLAKYGVPVRAFDTEDSPGVLRRFFPGAELLNASTVPGQMKIVDAAKGDAVTVIDAKAGLLSPMLKAFHRIDLLEDVKAGRIGLLVLHVVDTTVAAGGEIPSIIQAMKGANLIRINNRTKGDGTFFPTEPGEVVIEVPNLDETTWEAVDRANAPFQAFAMDAANSRVLRGYAREWLDFVHAAFDHAGIGTMAK